MQTEAIEYREGRTVLEGYLAYDEGLTGRRPGVLVVHEWMGPGPYEKQRAEQLAELGYIALAADIYGKGVRPKNAEEAAKTAGTFRADKQLLRARAKAGLEALKKHPLADSRRIAAIGYCFGGTTVLELARSGADLAGVVSFHGGLDGGDVAEARKIKARVLALHGGDDPYVPADRVAAFQDEMRKASVDWQMVIYGGAVHSFSNPRASNDKSAGAAYDARADKRSWEAMKQFFAEIF